MIFSKKGAEKLIEIAIVFIILLVLMFFIIIYAVPRLKVSSVESCPQNMAKCILPNGYNCESNTFLDKYECKEEGYKCCKYSEREYRIFQEMRYCEYQDRENRNTWYCDCNKNNQLDEYDCDEKKHWCVNKKCQAWAGKCQEGVILDEGICECGAYSCVEDEVCSSGECISKCANGESGPCYCVTANRVCTEDQKCNYKKVECE